MCHFRKLTALCLVSAAVTESEDNTADRGRWTRMGGLPADDAA
jgi:hypothetical protein